MKASFLVLLIVAFNALPLAAQCPKKIVKWVEQVSLDYPGVDMNQASAAEMKRIIYNLYSDKYFVPVFKKSIAEVSKKKLEYIVKAGYFGGCSSTIPGNLFEFSAPAENALGKNRNISANNMRDFSYEVVKAKAGELRNIRKETAALEKKLKEEKASPDFDFLVDWDRSLKSRYAHLLMPAEITSLTRLVSQHTQKIASDQIGFALAKVSILDNVYASLNPLLSFVADNGRYYSYLHESDKKKVDETIKNKTGQILDACVTADMKPLPSMQIRELNAFFESFNNKYQRVFNADQVRKANQEIIAAKVALVTKEKNELLSKIQSAETAADLTQLESFYLSHIQYSDNLEVSGLYQIMADRQEEIRQENIRREIARKEAIKRQQEQAERDRLLAEAEALKQLGFDFNTNGLQHSALFLNIFKGNFVDIPFNRDDMNFGTLISEYMYHYARTCSSNLPDNRVQIYEDQCKTESVTTNGFGVEVSRYCVDWVKVPTGLYADPNVYQAYSLVQSILDRDTFKHLGKMLTQMASGDGIQAMTSMVGDALSMKADLAELVRLNGCGNKAMKRFEENLIRFANNQAALTITGEVAGNEVDYNLPQNFKILIEDLIFENSKSWAMNKFIRNSVAGVSVTARDSQNRPSNMSASYQFEGLFGRQQYSVKISFRDGVPDCLYFQDYPNTCRTADRRIVAAFREGKYIAR
ncbi:hypothetical protein [Cyclobacterium plantarum]|uniref:Uncharacterized protein n=1 Tax=Cyclobacterium plantarum TaxID=2716263 RepID=A0ABX0H9P8_9BACT|nr:hypothetical protein [Cyclobacterium plantarum]NHE58619.1 hypothetical protein [Cyclobacterium plantarum]